MTEDVKYWRGYAESLERDMEEILQVAGKALGYPLWSDDPESANNPRPVGYICTGDKFPIDLVRCGN